MPTILDATVINKSYDTSGSGRKLVRLDNGWLVAVAKINSYFYFYKSEDNGNTWSQLCYVYHSYFGNGDVSLVSSGTVVHAVCCMMTNGAIYSYTFDAIGMANINMYDKSPYHKNVEGGQTTLGNVSLTINEAGTELHATWSSKNSSLSNSFNIRYAKGTINADGSVTWGAVEQVTTHNLTSRNVTNPTITFDKDGIPIIMAETSGFYIDNDDTTNFYTGTNASGILILKRSTELNASINIDTKWRGTGVGYSNSFAQSSPTAIFVPQIINGLANGRIWVTWHGTDSTDNNSDNIRVSYSDDGGVTWSAMQKLTSGNMYWQRNPSITCNKDNKVFIIFNGWDATDGFTDIKKLSNDGSGWSTSSIIKSGSGGSITNPSTLYDLSFVFSEPLFIYKDTAKVGFYGTWTTTQISVPQGNIGTKSDKNNLLSYSITTDGEMSTITEKVNGVVIGTKTATSGQSLVVGLTQAQWDAIKYGKYADATGDQNTLTIEMGSDKWTYTFDKQLASDADILSAVKAIKDEVEVSNPAKKVKLANAIRGKGGTVNDADSFEDMKNAIENMTSQKKASGSITSASSQKTFIQYDGTNSPPFGNIAFDMSVLGFIPSRITLHATDKSKLSPTTWYLEDYYVLSSYYANVAYNQYGLRCPYVNGVVNIPVMGANTNYTWEAYG
ncbi:sialidase family protein [Peribacillus loiseleuriae]|uniref:sialidase family protein n=1 Tax=Peribacillus loiseleuriae TaxID=1679170 RepID=UPI003D085D48